jgi:glyoxylase-like metal-dependent hydrolase (beta-lactamase superfamily II)
VITHHHFDHTGSLDKLKILSGAQVAAHSADAPYISENKKPVEMGFMRYMVNLIKFIYRTKPVEIDILLNDGDVINGYQVIQSPGHTPGSICLYNPQNKVLIVGDNLGYSKDKIVSPPANLLPEPEKYKKSMKKLENLDVEVILSGHSPPVTNEATSKLDEYLKDIN